VGKRGIGEGGDYDSRRDEQGAKEQTNAEKKDDLRKEHLRKTTKINGGEKNLHNELNKSNLSIW